MRWRNINAKPEHIGAGLLGAVLLPIVSLCAVVGATDTQIGVAVCGSDSQGAQIDIAQPLNDSVHNQSSLTFRGTVTNTSQIEVVINGDIDRTVAIAANQTAFNIDVLLKPGTHTVLLQANDICGGQDASDTVVITYDPITQPSSGTNTPTVVQGSQTLDGESVATESLTDEDVVSQIEQLPVIGAAVSIVSDFVTAIGLESTMSNGNASTVTGVARVAVTVAALTSVVMAGTFAPIAAQAVPGISEAFSVSSHRSMLYLEWVIRGVGALAMALAYFI